MKYKLTPEHEKQLKPWADKWIANAMSTRSIGDDREKIRDAVVELYKAADLEPPPLHRIVFVSSPIQAAFVAGFAAAIWHTRESSAHATYDATYAATHEATRAATYDATLDATYDATREATREATHDATYAATDVATDAATRAATDVATDAATLEATSDATYEATLEATLEATSDATYDATDDATRAATRAATRDATHDATYAATCEATSEATRAATRAATYAATYDATDDATSEATRDATRAATDVANENWYQFNVESMHKIDKLFKLNGFGLKCAKVAYRMRNGGNQWSGWTAFISFFRHIAKLNIDYSKWQHYETLAELSGPRYMHKKFCIVSDRPKTLLVNERNQPHCETGPFCEWIDGTKLFSLNGVRVPAWVVLTPKNKITKEQIIGEKNADIRREIIRKIGNERLAELLDYKVIDKFEDYELITFNIGDGRERPFLKMINPSIKTTHVEGVHPECNTVKDAIKFRNSLSEYQKPKELA